MRRKTVIHVGHGLSMPAGEAVMQTFGILSKKEQGKTYLGTLLAEGMIDASAQVIAVDPVMKWWALRLAANGRSRGKDIYVFGGKHGDIALAPESGKFLAKLLATKPISAVLDVTFLRKGQRARFLTEFGEEFLHQKQMQDDPHPVHIFLEEAQKVLPQMSRGQGEGYEKQMLGAWEDIVRIGRNCGIGVTMISQRPQSVNKEALSQVEALFALGVNEVPARKAIEAWVQEKEADREIIGELPGLPRGEAIFWSPSWLKFFGRVKIGKKSTLDVSASAKLTGRRRRYKLSKMDVRALGKEMEAAAEQAKRDDPVALRAEIAELKRELAKKRPPPPAPAKEVMKTVVKEVVVLKKRDLNLLEDARVTFALESKANIAATLKQASQELERSVKRTLEAVESGKKVAEALRSAMTARPPVRAVGLDGRPLHHPQPAQPTGRGRGFFQIDPVVVAKATKAPVTPKAPVMPAAADAPAMAVKAGARTMLRVLCGASERGMLRVELAVHSIISQTGGTFSDYLSSLRSRGYIMEDGPGRSHSIHVTHEGATAAQIQGGALQRRAAEIIQLWFASGKLKAGARRMMEALMEVGPHGALSKDVLAERADISLSGGTFSDYLSSLNSAGLVEKTAEGSVRPFAGLFIHDT